MSAYLPADQNHALMKVAGAVMELHSECIQKAKMAKAANISNLPPVLSPPLQKSDSTEIAEMTNMLNKSVLADPAGTIFSAAEHVLTDKRNFDEDLNLSENGDPNSTNNEKFFGEKNASRYSGMDLRKTKSPRKSLPIDRRKLLFLRFHLTINRRK